VSGSRSIADEKRFWLGTHRVVEPRATLDWLIPKLSVAGVTRVANVTGLDYIGIPVVTSCRPAARSLSVQQGKGATLDAAKVSAIMESVESFAAQQPSHSTIYRPIASLTGESFTFPYHLLRRRLRRDVVIPWVEGYDLLNRRATLVPEELVRLDASWPRPKGYGWFAGNSKGLAAGNTRDEALVHALCELIERDAYSLWRQMPYDARARTRINPSSIKDPDVAELMARYDKSNMLVELWDITSDLDVPCFFCVIDDRYGRPPYLGRFGGVGCHSSAAIALSRALSEAAQSRLTFIVGTREDILPDDYAAVGWKHNYASLLAVVAESVEVDMATDLPPSFDRQTMTADIDAILARFEAAGIDSVVIVDLTTEQLDIPCIRAISANLEGSHQQSGYKPGIRAQRMSRRWNT